MPLSHSELVVPRMQREEVCATDLQSANITLEDILVSAIGLAVVSISIFQTRVGRQ